MNILKKKVIIGGLASAIILGSSNLILAESMNNFTQINNYQNGNFRDVSSSSWYYKDVKDTYELDLMKGTGNDRFSPLGNITISETITLASKVHAIYNQNEIDTKGKFSNWYDPYINYAKENNIIDSKFTNYRKNATRAELIHIFSNSISEKELNSINKVSKIPDVKNDTKYSDSIFKLYNAGIIKGSDDMGTFKPQTNISRSETAAIINRLINKNNRLKFKLKEVVDISNDLAIKNDLTSLLNNTFGQGLPRFKVNQLEDKDLLNIFGIQTITSANSQNIFEFIGPGSVSWKELSKTSKKNVDNFSVKYFDKKVNHENHKELYNAGDDFWSFYYDSGNYYYEFAITGYGYDKYMPKQMKRLNNGDIEANIQSYYIDLGDESVFTERELIQISKQEGTSSDLLVTFESKGDRYIIKEVLDLEY